MHSTAAERTEFAPPSDKGSLRALGLALLIHVLLIAALTWGVNWKRSDKAASFEAELWSSTPQQAAPKLVETSPPAPVPAPSPAPAPPPPPPPAAKAPEVKPPAPAPDVDIALAQEKKRKLQQEKEAEAKKAEKLREKQEAELQAKKEKEKEKKKEKEQKASEELAKRKALEEAKKAEAKKQEAKDQEKQKLAAATAEKKKLATEAAAAADKQHQAAVKRIMGLAGATGGADAKGSALKASGPSASYGGKVKAKVLPNVVFTDDIAGNPTAEVEVRTTSDGTIMSQRLVKSSGNKAWDDAVIKAIIRTGAMPRDVDGRVPTPMILEFRPRD